MLPVVLLRRGAAEAITEVTRDGRRCNKHITMRHTVVWDVAAVPRVSDPCIVPCHAPQLLGKQIYYKWSGDLPSTVGTFDNSINLPCLLEERLSPCFSPEIPCTKSYGSLIPALANYPLILLAHQLRNITKRPVVLVVECRDPAPIIECLGDACTLTWVPSDATTEMHTHTHTQTHTHTCTPCGAWQEGALLTDCRDKAAGMQGRCQGGWWQPGL
eukprot:1159725-Pelagomonas_calceolata.AAC.5